MLHTCDNLVNWLLLTYVQGVPELSEHTLLREYRHCGVTVEAAATKRF